MNARALVLVLVSGCLIGCASKTKEPHLRGYWTVDILDVDFEGSYAADVVASANQKLKLSVREEFPDVRLECELVPNIHGYQVIWSAPHRLDESQERRLADLVTRAMKESVHQVIHPGQKRANQTPEPTALLVTPRAGARVAPSSAVAHL